MRIVLGYHGCSSETALDLLGGSEFRQSQRDYDWLGSGAYFWEGDILRAHHWAVKRGYAQPSVVGAVIDLDHCLDLTVQDGLRAVRRAYEGFEKLQTLRNKPMPVNEDASQGPKGDLLLRRRDRSVMEHLNAVQDKAAEVGSRRFDTIRALFPEGDPLYPNAGFREYTHVQICVRAPKNILGVFRVPKHQQAILGLAPLYETLTRT